MWKRKDLTLREKERELAERILAELQSTNNRQVPELMAENARLLQANESLQKDCDYWRERAEKLLDNALLRKGEVTEPVMSPATPKPPDPMTSLFRGLNTLEIESGKKGRP